LALAAGFLAGALAFVEAFEDAGLRAAVGPLFLDGLAALLRAGALGLALAFGAAARALGLAAPRALGLAAAFDFAGFFGFADVVFFFGFAMRALYHRAMTVKRGGRSWVQSGWRASPWISVTSRAMTGFQ
jgi:hypothetical protein